MEERLRRRDGSDWWAALAIGSNPAANIFGETRRRYSATPAIAGARRISQSLHLWSSPISDLFGRERKGTADNRVAQDRGDFAGSLRFNA